MEQHYCLHIEDFKHNEKEHECIYGAIFGNGSKGMKTDIELIKQMLETMPSGNALKLYSFFGGAIGVIFGAIGMIIWKAVGA